MEDYLRKCWLTRVRNTNQAKIPGATLQEFHPHCATYSPSGFHPVLCPYGIHEFQDLGEGHEPSPMQLYNFNFGGNQTNRAALLQAGHELPWPVYFAHAHGWTDDCSCEAEAQPYDPLTREFRKQLGSIRLRPGLILNPGERMMETRWLVNENQNALEFLEELEIPIQAQYGKTISINPENEDALILRATADEKVKLSILENYNFTLWTRISVDSTIVGYWLNLGESLEESQIEKIVYTHKKMALIFEEEGLEEFIQNVWKNHGLDDAEIIEGFVHNGVTHVVIGFTIDDGNAATTFLNRVREWRAEIEGTTGRLIFRRKAPYRLSVYDQDGVEIVPQDNHCFNLKTEESYFALINKPSSRTILPLDKFHLNISSAAHGNGLIDVAGLPPHQACTACGEENCGHFPMVFSIREQPDLWMKISSDDEEEWIVDIDRYQTSDDRKLGGSDMRIRYTLTFSEGGG